MLGFEFSRTCTDEPMENPTELGMRSEAAGFDDLAYRAIS